MASDMQQETPDESMVSVPNLTVLDAPQETPEAEEEYGEPRGALTFVLLMLGGYAVYWTITYFEIFIGRGA
ncbi:MAG: hypothetical protein OHK0046_25220 [Anaerolineae bacterium]